MREVKLVALLWLVGCGSTSSTPEAADASLIADAAAAPAPRFSEIYAELFPATTNARCNFCHSMPASDTSNGKLSVGETQDKAYAALVGVDSTSSHCGGMRLVAPGDPDSSLFLLKFSEPAPCGSRMPLGGKALDAAQLAKIRAWIVAGAKND